MLPLQIILKLLYWLRASDGPPADEEDPLRHPHLARMTARQLADLPMPRPAPMMIDAQDVPTLKRCA